MLDVGTVVIEPNLLCWLSLCEEQNVSLYSLRIEYASRQTQDSVQIEVRKKAFTDSLASPIPKLTVVVVLPVPPF